MTITAIELPMEEIAEFCQRWQVIEFALFGSVLRYDFRPHSDIDVWETSRNLLTPSTNKNY
jgi:predicted nucleotidyltransferase